MRALTPNRFIIFLLMLVFASQSFAVDLGLDDRQISTTGPSSSNATDAVTPAIAFDSINQRYLTVWSADQTDGDFEIYGQLLTGAAGAPIGVAFAIGTGGVAGADHRQPVVAFDDVHQRYLVVWSSDAASLGAYEIYGQMVTLDGSLVGPAHRYSDMGTNDLDTAFDAVTPDVAWHAGLDAFVVAWAGDDDTGLLSDGRFEIYGQLVDGATGAETGVNDIRISFAGADANGNDATNPSIAVTSDPTRWFVAFEGDVLDDGVHNPEVWMYGVTSDVPDGAAAQLSLMGGSYLDSFSARNPDLAWAPSSGELICVWDGADSAGVPRAIFGQRVLPDGTVVGAMIPMSYSSPTPSGMLREAIEPAIAVNPYADTWFVTWRGDLDDGLIQYDHEIWAARFNDVGTPLDVFAYTLSNMDPSLGPVAGASAPAVAINEVHGYKMVVWSGDLDTSPGDNFEIFAQGWADDAVTSVDDLVPATAFRLHAAEPNPFNPMTTIRFELPEASRVRLRVYDIAGRLVQTLVDDESMTAGQQGVVWRGRDGSGRQVAAGTYIYRIEADGYSDMKSMTLLK